MDHQARIAFIQTQTACCLAEMEAMKAANAARQQNGLSLAYGEDAFMALPAQYGIHHNQVIEYLREG